MRTLLTLSLITLTACEEGMKPVSTDADGGNAFSALESPQGEREELFRFGGKASNQVVDYVFVVDNSVSMGHVLKKMKAGFKKLATSDFPSEARIAVLSTLPADFEQPGELHPIVGRPELTAFDPGFNQFVSKASIERSVTEAPETAKRLSLEGCGDDGWFSPGEKNAQGVPCLIAHTQITRLPTNAEAGLTALKQLLEKNTGKETFRPGASVNVIFVSDTHDPGVGGKAGADLFYQRPTPEQLLTLIKADNTVSSVRFHAIAPESECVEKWAHFGPAYYNAADLSGGVTLDICTSQDYTPLLKSLLDVGARPVEPVFALGAEAESVDSVVVNGTQVPFTVHPNNKVVTVEIPPVAHTPGVMDPTQEVKISYVRTFIPSAVEPKVRARVKARAARK